MGVIAKGIPRGCQGLFTPVSLGYPLSVFNKNSTLKDEKSKKGGRGANDRDKTCSKNWDTKKKINSSSLGISSPLESGQIERWYFDRRARKRIPVIKVAKTRLIQI